MAQSERDSIEMKTKSFLLIFDMDGVLLDSATAITGSLHYALHKNGQTQLSESDLTQFVGPPLHVMLNALIPDAEQDLRNQCAIDYRTHNNANGPVLTTVYEGMQEVVTELSHSFELRIATSKLESAAELVLKAKDFYQIFDGVHGSGTDGADTKTDVMRRALSASHFSNPNIRPLAMIGDRKHDVEGAKNLGIESIGVTWGYASPGELETAEPEHVVSTPKQLLSLIYRLAEQSDQM